jgi:UDP-sulfoquinovose synthase
MDNPRKEAAENELVAEHEGLLHLGLVPTRLADALLDELLEIGRHYSARCDQSKIFCHSRWENNNRPEPEEAESQDESPAAPQNLRLNEDPPFHPGLAWT